MGSGDRRELFQRTESCLQKSGNLPVFTPVGQVQKFMERNFDQSTDLG
jgi:hypothetical protein